MERNPAFTQVKITHDYVRKMYVCIGGNTQRSWLATDSPLSRIKFRPRFPEEGYPAEIIGLLLTTKNF
jgi:hypothetical protein